MFREAQYGIIWKRRESTSNPGKYYYLNTATNETEEKPPTVKPPWVLCESKTKKGQFYYYHEESKESVVDPPVSAGPASEVQQNISQPPIVNAANTATRLPSNTGAEQSQPKWIKIESSRQP